jgi:hypothetical protein
VTARALTAQATGPLTIGMFSDSYLPERNGLVTSVVGAAHALRRRGHRVIVVARTVKRTTTIPTSFAFARPRFHFTRSCGWRFRSPQAF